MGLETLSGHGLNVTRPDCEELLAIRDGAWTFDELEQCAEQRNAQLHAAKSLSSLPDEPDGAMLDGLCLSIIERELGC